MPPWRRDKEKYTPEEITSLVKENNKSLVDDIIGKISISELLKDLTTFEEHMYTLEPIMLKDTNNTKLFDSIREAHYPIKYSDVIAQLGKLGKYNKIRLMHNAEMSMFELE